jgi:hypothetical protein
MLQTYFILAEEYISRSDNLHPLWDKYIASGMKWLSVPACKTIRCYVGLNNSRIESIKTRFYTSNFYCYASRNKSRHGSYSKFSRGVQGCGLHRNLISQLASPRRWLQQQFPQRILIFVPHADSGLSADDVINYQSHHDEVHFCW